MPCDSNAIEVKTRPDLSMVIGVDFVELESKSITAWLDACVSWDPSLQGRRRYGCVVDCDGPWMDLPVFEMQS